MTESDSAVNLRSELDTAVSGDSIRQALVAAGWIYAGDDAELVRQILADPHRGDHILQLRNDGWTLQHPIIERIDGDLFRCPLDRHARQFAALWDTAGEGRYRIWLDDDHRVQTEPLQA